MEIFRQAFLAAGITFFGIVLLMMLRFFGSYGTETADLIAKLGIGMMIGAVACAIVERK